MIKTSDILDEKDKHLRAKNKEVVFPLSKERKKLINDMLEHLYYSQIEEYAENCGYIRIAVPAGDISKAVGHKKSNIAYMKSKGVEVKIVPSADDKIEIIERR